VDLLEQALKLPQLGEFVVPAEYLDANNHMNVMYYTGIGNLVIGSFFANLGLPVENFGTGQRGTFALQQVINYLSELRLGDKIAVHSGLIGYDAKRLHFMHYIINTTHQRLASTDERLAIYIDMTTRRSTSFEPEVLANLAQAQQRFDTLGWTPQLSGAIKLKK
jgi:acyl-CoA thioester hydrolase